MLSKFPVSYEDFSYMYINLLKTEFPKFVMQSYAEFSTEPSKEFVGAFHHDLKSLINYLDFMAGFSKDEFTCVTSEIKRDAVRYCDNFDAYRYMQECKEFLQAILVELDKTLPKVKNAKRLDSIYFSDLLGVYNKFGVGSLFEAVGELKTSATEDDTIN